MQAVQLNAENSLYISEDEIVVYAKLSKQTYLLTLLQSNALKLYLLEQETGTNVQPDEWRTVCCETLNISIHEFNELVSELVELNIIDVVDCE